MAKSKKKRKNGMEGVMNISPKLAKELKKSEKNPMEYVTKQYKKYRSGSKRLKGDGFLSVKPSKKEIASAVLQSTCNHHRLNKKGKVQPAIIRKMDGTCQCYACGQSFSYNRTTRDELKEILSQFIEKINQDKYISEAYGISKGGLDKYLTTLSLETRRYIGIHDRISKVSAAASKHKNKNRSRNNQTGNSFGGWAARGV